MKESLISNPFLLRSTLSRRRTNGAQKKAEDTKDCELMLKSDIWSLQREQLLQDNRCLLLALQHAQAALKQLTRDSELDALTQTLNRNIMLDRINQAVSIAKRQSGLFALLFIDLNKFKPVNDQYGHGAGDAVLQQVSARLKSAIRESDAISRHGGDEFLLLLNHISKKEDAKQFAAKMTRLLAQPYQIENGTALLSASIGVATFPTDGDTTQALIHHADAAMYRTKKEQAVIHPATL